MIPSESALPEPFGKYLLDREIARGGMARVHLARLRGLGGFEKRLVVKQILPQLALDPRFVSMFVEEAKTLVQMSHPHIVPVYELGVVDGVYFLAMEYVEGATLADVLDESVLEPAQAAHVGAQICDALSYAHERFSVVHRDVTPRNVMVDAVGHCRLLDFGIAAPAEADAGGALFGTPGYLSPEQARGEAIGAASDLFSVGALLHHALAGAPPVSPRELEALREGRVRIASLREREVDPELAALVDRALALEPGDRPESARALARALRGWLAGHSPEGVAHELGARAERARSRRERRRASERPPAAGSTVSLVTGSIDAPRAGHREPTGKVRTLAQSRALDEIIEGTARLDRASAPRASGSGSGEVEGSSGPSEAEPGTARIERASAPGPTTTPLERASAPSLEARGERSAASPRTRREREPTSAARGGGIAPLVTGGMLLGALVVGLVVALGASEPPAEQPPSIAAPPAEAPTHRADPRPPPAEPARPSPASEPAPRAPEPPPSPSAEPAEPARSAAADQSSARSATIAVSSRDWAEIRLDGRPLGTTPIRRAQIAAGAHTLVAENAPLGLRASTTFRAEPGERLRVVVDFRATPPEVLVERPRAPR